MKGPSENKDLKKKFEDFSYPVSDANWDAISSRLPEGNSSGFLAGKFANYTTEPSSTVWGNITAVIQPSQRTRPLAWWWYAAAASLLVFVYMGYAVFDSAVGPKQLVQEKAAKTPQKKEEKVSENGIAPLTVDSSNSVASVPIASAETVSATDSINENNESGQVQGIPLGYEELANIAGKIVPVINLSESAIAKYNHTSGNSTDGPDSYPVSNFYGDRAATTLLAKAAPREPEIKGSLLKPDFAAFTNMQAEALAIPNEKNKKSSGFYDGTETTSAQNFSLWAGSLLAFGNSASQNNMELVNSNFNNGVGTGSGEITADLSMNSIAKNYATPVFYGVNGEIKFWNHMAAGLGVGFLQMRTTAIQTYWNGDEVVQESEQRYLSLPFYVKFNFVDKSKFAAYTSLGHGYDILLGQKVSTESSSNAQFIVSGNLPHEDQGNQANLYAGLGMHFKFSRQFGVFAEGSLMHYYHLSNSNFFDQQKYWPGLRFGLLMTFD